MTQHILLEDRTGFGFENDLCNGTVLLDVRRSASIKHRGADLDMNSELEAVAETTRVAGRDACAIPGGGSNPTGALGHAICALKCSTGS